MGSHLYVGIAAHDGVYEVAAVEHGQGSPVMRFPADGKGAEAINVWLTNYGQRLRLALAGAAALPLGLKLGKVAGRETFIVAQSVAGHATALARYAEHAL